MAHLSFMNAADGMKKPLRQAFSPNMRSAPGVWYTGGYYEKILSICVMNITTYI